MRIISGLAKGTRLNAPDGRSLRPTEDRVKESVFSSLGDLRGCLVIDLFSGTGALGLEALSRGAAKVVFLERDRNHIKFIESNLAAVRKAIGPAVGECSIVCADARNTMTALAEFACRADVILADPPYSETADDFGPTAIISSNEFAAWAGPQCILSLEHSSSTILPWHPLSCWEPIKEKDFGIRAVSMARLFREDGNDNE